MRRWPIGLLAMAAAALPLDEGRCPASHPIKAVVSPRTTSCLYHVPSGQHYNAVKPDFCFASEDDARQEDCFRAEEVL